MPTLAQWMETYLSEVASAKVRPSTLHRYREEVEHHIGPMLGRHRLDKLTPAHLTSFYRDRVTVRSVGSVRRMHANLRRALNVAVRWQLIHSNPAALVEPPSLPHVEVRPYSLAQARRFLKAVEGLRLEARWLIGIALGLRLHDLRHTAESVLLAQGVPARVVMEILGHSQISVTLNIYAHVAPEVAREAAARLEGALWSGE
ncbi:tyrosine-type recombinase/integrase [Micromonospora luteifusca]|uniref:tyrosine-type recombinase/integrase n=1 Tax=Micromonospora luteifusca TaxID=709860 RepID=UPI0033AAB988